jgi:potassium-dependent mechanosensitive channel
MYFTVRIFILFLTFVLSMGALAEDKKVDLKQALELNQELDGISLDIIRINNLSALEDVAKDLDNLNRRATVCIDQMEKELEGIRKQLSELESLGAEPTPELSYLFDKEQSIKQILSQCRLADLRLKDLNAAVTERIEQKFFSQLFRHGKPLWQILPQKIDDLWQLSKLVDVVSIIHFNIIHKRLWLGAGILAVIGIIIGFIIRVKLASKAVLVKNKTFLNHLAQCSRRFLICNAYLLIPLILIAVFFNVLSLVYQQRFIIGVLSLLLLIYALFAIFTRLMFYSERPLKAILHVPRRIGKNIYWILQIIAWILIANYIWGIVFPEQKVSAELLMITDAFFVISITLLLFALCIWVVWIPYLRLRHGWLTMVTGSIVALGLILVLISEVVGLHFFAKHILIGLLSTIGITLIVWNIYQLIEAVLDLFSDKELAINIKTRQWLGVKRQRNLAEIMTLKLALYILLWGSFAVVLFNIWGLPETDYQKIMTTIFSGFTIGKLPVYPMRIIWALIIFSGLALLTRFLCARYLKSYKADIHKGAHQAVATMMSYIGFVLALLIGLLIAGVNFTGLAIIAGALSVGIGLGLQNIANNFISGIILLLERPIKVGDRIMVGDVEGFVKKISIRATQITTLDQTDVIVPNSQLVSDQVTNLMFRDFQLRVCVTVGVAYGSDTELVRRLLLQAGEQHPDVIDDDPKCKPYVIFENFGDNSLGFKLYCIIRDANKKYIVPSDLHFQIDKLFREHNVTIAFPQRDIHIKNWLKDDVKEHINE